MTLMGFSINLWKPVEKPWSSTLEAVSRNPPCHHQDNGWELSELKKKKGSSFAQSNTGTCRILESNENNFRN